MCPRKSWNVITAETLNRIWLNTQDIPIKCWIHVKNRLQYRQCCGSIANLKNYNYLCFVNSVFVVVFVFAWGQFFSQLGITTVCFLLCMKMATKDDPEQSKDPIFKM